MNCPKSILNYLGFTILLLCVSCREQQSDFDASGSFEAEETIISAQTPGLLIAFDVAEGQQLKIGQRVGVIDTLPLHLKKKQLMAKIGAVLSRKPDKKIQLASLREQLNAARVNQKRIANLVKAKAANQKQLDDINSDIAVLKKKMRALKSSLDIQSSGIDKESLPVQIQIEQLDDQIRRCLLDNPIEGKVLTRYARVHEMVGAGKPLYKIANLSYLILRVYVTNDQLVKIKLGQQVKVLTDNGEGGFKETEGSITWISDQAEFTPKTIQTKNERANLVYAVKIKVKNDGSYKIGMYGEIKF